MYKIVIKKFLGKKVIAKIRSIKNSLNFKKLTIKKNDKFFTVYCKDNLEFWKNVQEGIWEPQTYKILKKFLDKNYTYIEIGAWIGPTALYGCQLAKHCFAIEPDPIAFEELRKNIQLNQHLSSRITLSNVCIYNSIGIAKLFTPSESLGQGGRSNSTILDQGLKNFWKVQMVTFSKFIQSLSIVDCNFIKIDIEGSEFEVLLNMLEFIENQKPTLLIEFHPMFVKNYYEKLKELNPIFDCYRHIYNKNLEEIDMKYILNLDITKTFHLVLSENNV